MTKRVLLLFSILCLLAQSLLAQIQDVPVIKRADGQFYRYEVKPKETVYSLCKRFDVTDQELLKFNPDLSEGLKKGQILIIPVKKSTPEKPQSTALIPVQKAAAPSSPAVAKPILKESVGNALIYSADKPRVTLILPYSSTAAANANQRYTEFYEGFLLAVDSLKNRGVSFEVQVLESDLGGESVRKIIESGKLAQTDLCIGGVSAEQITLLSEWASQNQHPLVVPFSSRVPEVDANSYVYQTITPYSHVYDQLATYAAQKAGVHTVVFLQSLSADANDPRMALINKLKERFKSMGIAYKEVAEDETLAGLSKVLSPTRQNLIFPSPVGLQETGSMLVKLSALKNSNPEISMTLYGYPDWMALGKVQQKYLYELNAVIYSNFFADMQQNLIRQFQIRFNQVYNHPLMNMFPKYGMMGYDVAASFIPKMIFENLGVKDESLNLEPLQSVFRFKRSNEQSGMVNQTYFLIEYRKDFSQHTTVMQ